MYVWCTPVELNGFTIVCRMINIFGNFIIYILKCEQTIPPSPKKKN